MEGEPRGGRGPYHALELMADLVDEERDGFRAHHIRPPLSKLRAALSAVRIAIFG